MCQGFSARIKAANKGIDLEDDGKRRRVRKNIGKTVKAPMRAEGKRTAKIVLPHKRREGMIK
jgi:hypothetical protein